MQSVLDGGGVAPLAVHPQRLPWYPCNAVHGDLLELLPTMVVLHTWGLGRSGIFSGGVCRARACCMWRVGSAMQGGTLSPTLTSGSVSWGVLGDVLLRLG